MIPAFSVRLFELQADGKLEALHANDIEYYGGACPNVGDTIGQLNGLGDAYRFYNVQRRVFVDAGDGNQGWAVVVRPIEESSFLSGVMTAWIDDTAFWYDVEQSEREEESARTRELLNLPKKKAKQSSPPVSADPPVDSFKEWKRNQAERDKHRPHHNLTAPEQRALRFMIDHPECLTADLIPRVGDKTLEAMAKVGVVRPGGKDHRGFREWYVTDEGRAELDRIETWTNW